MIKKDLMLTHLNFSVMIAKKKNFIVTFISEKAKAIDRKIFDLYGLTPEEREAIGYIDIK